MLSSCEDEFTEQDAIRAQQETLAALEDQEAKNDAMADAMQDSLDRIGAKIDYTVTVAAAGQSNTGRTSSASSAEGAVVTLVQGGKTFTETAGKGGVATFAGLSRGQAVVTVEVADHTAVTYTTTLGFSASGTDGKENYNVGTLIPVFPTTVEAGATEIKGKAWAELDATNDMPEAAQGAVVRGTLDVGTVLTSYRQGNSTYGKVETATYDGFSNEATVGDDGTYSLIMPNGKGSNGVGFAPTVKFMPFVATQKYAEVKDGIIMEVEKEVIFGGANTPAANNNHISNATPGIYAEIAAPDAKPEGFALEAELVGNEISQDLATVVKGGTGYAVNDVFELSADKDDNKGQLIVNSVSDGVITSFYYNNPDDAVYTDKPTITQGQNVGGSGAELDFEFIDLYAVKVANAGSGYWTTPKVSVVVADNNGQQYPLPDLLNSESEFDQYLDVEDGKVGEKDEYVSVDFETYKGYDVIPSMIEPVFNVENPMVKQAMIDPSLITIEDGRISNNAISNPDLWIREVAFVGDLQEGSQQMFDGGAGYLTQPKVTFKSAAGAGTGAEGIAMVEDGKVVGIIITKSGSGYKTEANKETHDELNEGQSFQTYGTNGDGELTPGVSNVGINFSYGAGQLQ